MMRERGDWGRERGGHSRLDRRARGQKARAQLGSGSRSPDTRAVTGRCTGPSCLAGSARSCCILPLSLRPFALRPLLRPLLLDAADRAAASLQRLHALHREIETFSSSAASSPSSPSASCTAHPALCSVEPLPSSSRCTKTFSSLRLCHVHARMRGARAGCVWRGAL